MPVRSFSREQSWLLPPTLDELIPPDHAVRFVAAIIDGLDRAAWLEMGVDADGEALGAPSYHPRVLLCVWLYGFISGVRSARKLEDACREQLPYLWLTGCQRPDHNTLWRFYKEHRAGMRKLFKRTVKTGVRLGLVNLVLQALDGTKIAGNAAKDRTYDQEGLEKLLKRTEEAIAKLEAQNSTGGEPSPPQLPPHLAKAKNLHQQVQAALAEVKAEEGPKRVNLTDGDAGLVKSRQGFVAGYNAQAMVGPLDVKVAGRKGQFITAVDVVKDPDDHAQLVPMIAMAEEITERKVETTLADSGYHSGENLEECAKRGSKVLMPEGQEKAVKDPYHQTHFRYDPELACYICPQGQKLHCRGKKKREGRGEVQVYGATAKTCRACPAFGQCTKDKRKGRLLEIGPYRDISRRHREMMATEEAKEVYGQRQELPEPVFGILKEQQGARRFLLRGLEKVRSEWTLLATAFNLRTLYRIWQRYPTDKREAMTGAAC